MDNISFPPLTPTTNEPSIDEELVNASLIAINEPLPSIDKVSTNVNEPLPSIDKVSANKEIIPRFFWVGPSEEQKKHKETTGRLKTTWIDTAMLVPLEEQKETLSFTKLVKWVPFPSIQFETPQDCVVRLSVLQEDQLVPRAIKCLDKVVDVVEIKVKNSTEIHFNECCFVKSAPYSFQTKKRTKWVIQIKVIVANRGNDVENNFIEFEFQSSPINVVARSTQNDSKDINKSNDTNERPQKKIKNQDENVWVQLVVPQKNIVGRSQEFTVIGNFPPDREYTIMLGKKELDTTIINSTTLKGEITMMKSGMIDLYVRSIRNNKAESSGSFFMSFKTLEEEAKEEEGYTTDPEK